MARKAKAQDNGTFTFSGGTTDQTFSQIRSSAPNPVQALWDASKATGAVQRVDITPETAKLLENSVRRAARESDMGYRLEVHADEGYALFAATQKRARKYTVQDIRAWAGLGETDQVSEELRAEFRRANGLDTITDVKAWAVASGLMDESERVTKENREALLERYREAFGVAATHI